MKKNEILDTAKGLVTADRCKEYGTPKENFQRIADMWTILLEKVLKEGTKITPGMVANCMVSVKQTRLIQSEDHVDSWVDIAGYAGCGGEVTETIKDPTKMHSVTIGNTAPYYTFNTDTLHYGEQPQYYTYTHNTENTSHVKY